jgi:hypothetical protein
MLIRAGCCFTAMGSWFAQEEEANKLFNSSVEATPPPSPFIIILLPLFQTESDPKIVLRTQRPPAGHAHDGIGWSVVVLLLRVYDT